MQADVSELQKMEDDMAAMTLRGSQAGPAAAAHAPWQRLSKLPPLDQQALVGQQAQLVQLQELMHVDGRTVLTIWGSAGMVSLACYHVIALLVVEPVSTSCCCHGTLVITPPLH